MYLRETKRRNRDGSVVSYLQLAHSERHSVSGIGSAAEVLYELKLLLKLVTMEGIVNLLRRDTTNRTKTLTVEETGRLTDRGLRLAHSPSPTTSSRA